MTQIYNDTEYDDSIGSPFDTGTRDALYNNGAAPHYFVIAEKGSCHMNRVEQRDMLVCQQHDYWAGYNYGQHMKGTQI